MLIIRVRSYWTWSKSDSAFRLVDKKSNLMIVLSSDKDQRKIRFRVRLCFVQMNINRTRCKRDPVYLFLHGMGWEESYLAEQQPMGDVLGKHEARQQVVNRPRFPAVRPQDERVEPPLPEKHNPQIIFTPFQFIT